MGSVGFVLLQCGLPSDSLTFAALSVVLFVKYLHTDPIFLGRVK
jgi:hypothetical protein